MRVLVTGVKGQLGYDVMNELAKRGYEGVGVDVDEMDITDARKVDEVITKAQVDKVVHCAAYTAVDAAEDNVELCRRVNAEGTENIAKVCKRLDLPMVYLSTDYVFDGEGERAPAEMTITKADFFEWGLSGRPDSAARRAAVLKALDLPQHMTANALLEFINAVGTRQQLCEILQSFSSGD